ncbi:hypothetical protein BsWGS_08028 [Bradybaena similaris]
MVVTNNHYGLAMSQDRPAAFREAEGPAFIRIEFHFQISDTGTISIHTADCAVHVLIGVMKREFERLFGDPAHQEWFYRTRKLTDDRTLSSYGIGGRDRSITQIYVRQSRPEPWQ